MDSLSLLVVDDEVDFADFVKDVAQEMNFDVISTDDPFEFNALYDSHINIIVLDLFMPGMDGIELLRLLHQQQSKAAIIFMSGNDVNLLHSAQKIALEQGLTVLGILQKPFRAKELEHMLAQYGQKSGPENLPLSDPPSPSELRQAIEQEELFLVFQPQINIASRKVTGLEALIRWRHPVKGNIPARNFIPVAEDNGLITGMTSFATKTAFRQMALWHRHGLNLQISINFSPKMLDSLDFPEQLSRHAVNMGADISKITIEVTETTLMTDVKRYMDILTRLRMKGFRLAIDDFGTGYSSLKQLVRAPFSELKIDQIFVKNIADDKECLSIVEISILLAHKLGMRVVAEGIENEKIYTILQELRCDEGQGYWIAKPMLADEIEPWIASWP